MNICTNCGHELVNIIYGMPGAKLVEMAKTEDIALGGCTITEDSPKLYCYGCHETF
jgi:hypothetical protein